MCRALSADDIAKLLRPRMLELLKLALAGGSYNARSLRSAFDAVIATQSALLESQFKEFPFKALVALAMSSVGKCPPLFLDPGVAAKAVQWSLCYLSNITSSWEPVFLPPDALTAEALLNFVSAKRSKFVSAGQAVLSLDGGWVKGLAHTIVLKHLEADVTRERGVTTRVSDMFDLVAGTGVGGLVALGILAGKDTSINQSINQCEFTRFENVYPKYHCNCSASRDS